MSVEWKKVRMQRTFSSASFGSTCAGESRLLSPKMSIELHPWVYTSDYCGESKNMMKTEFPSV